MSAGLGMFVKLQRHELLHIVFTIWIVQLIVSPTWLKYFQFGPIEWLWRNLSYQKMHAFRKTKVVQPNQYEVVNDAEVIPVLNMNTANN